MKIKELFSGPDRWIQKSYARDINNNITTWNATNAHSFCLIGAVCHCYTLDTNIRSEIYKKLRAELYPEMPAEQISIAEWNDAPERTFEDVKKLVNDLDI